MNSRPRTGRRFRPIMLAAVLPAALAGALVLGVAFVAPTASADTDARASVRTKIANAAIGQIGSRESGGEDMYPKRYKTSSKVVRPAEWCGVFTNWAWLKGGATKRPNMAGNSINQGHWATYWQKWGKDNNRWKPLSRRNPAKGDAIVYGNYPASRHVGVVVAVKKNSAGKVTQVRTVEGNVSDKVTDRGWRKIGSLSNAGIKASGFVSPV